MSDQAEQGSPGEAVEVDTEGRETEPPRPLHPAAVPIWLMYDAGRFFFALLPAIILGGVQPFMVPIVLPFVVMPPIVRYRRFRYQLSGNTLIVEGGLLNRWRRVIPRQRVQSVDIVEKLRHRLFAVVEVRVEAIGAEQTEAALVAVGRSEAERIKRWATGVDGHGADEDHEEPAYPVLAHLASKDLILAGITGGRVAVLAVLLGYAQEFLGEDTFERGRDVVETLFPETPIVTAAAILVVGLIVASLVLSIVATVLVYWQFTLTLEQDRLVIRRGLLERRRAQIPLRRLQAVQINENIVRRWFGLASLTVVVAGYTEQGQQSEQTSMLLPIGSRRTAWEIAARVLHAPTNIAATPLLPRPKRALGKRLTVWTVLVGTAAAGPVVLAGGLAAAGLLLVPLGWLGIYLGHRVAGHAIAEDHVVVRSGVIVTKTTVVPRDNLQHLKLTWTMLQSRFDLATVRLHIPRAVPRATDIDRGEAGSWFEELGAA